MKLKELVEKLRESKSSSCNMLDMWLGELNEFSAIYKVDYSSTARKDLSETYERIYGFIRGLQALEYISDDETDVLLSELINVAFRG